MKRIFIAFSLLANFMFAGIPVFDPANLMQNVAAVIQQIKQLTLMKSQIDKEIESAKRITKKLNVSNITNIKDIFDRIKTFRNKARSVGYSYENISRQFEKTYGKNGTFAKNFKTWQKQSDDSLKEALVAQGLLEKSEKHMQDLDKVLQEKRGADNDLATLHAIGEINAIQSKQLAELSEIIATDARAKNSVILEERSKEKDLKNYENHLMKDFNKHGVSKPLNRLPSLGSVAI